MRPTDVDSLVIPPFTRWRVACCAAAILLFAATIAGRAGAVPIAVGNGGASAVRPEHTVEAHRLAIQQGADAIHVDVVSTKDGVLVARIDNELTRTTDVASRPEFAGRETTKVVDGVVQEGWFAEDFTLAELKTLRATTRLPDLRPASAAFDGLYEIPTLQEAIDGIQLEAAALGKTVGIHVELQHPSYFDALGLSMEEPLVAILDAEGYSAASAPVFLQSFEVGALMELDALTDVRLLQGVADGGAPYDLVLGGDPRTYADLIAPAGLAAISAYADGIDADKDLLIPRDAADGLLTPTTLVDDAHGAGLLVFASVFRPENAFLPADERIGDPGDPGFPATPGDLAGEIARFTALGIDGYRTDQILRDAAPIPEPSAALLFLIGTAVARCRSQARAVRPVAVE